MCVAAATRMSGGGGGGSSRVPIPNNVRKIIQDIREITGKQHTDDEIYAVLRECSMDPNETAQKLLYLGFSFLSHTTPFHSSLPDPLSLSPCLIHKLKLLVSSCNFRNFTYTISKASYGCSFLNFYCFLIYIELRGEELRVALWTVKLGFFFLCLFFTFIVQCVET